MADSENSRTLPSNRYRNLLPATERLLSDLAVGAYGANDYGAPEALAKWAAWSLAHSECSRLCSVQQRLESELFRTTAKQPTERDLSRDTPSSTKAELVMQGRGAPDQVAGHNRARAAEDAASAREQLLAEELCSVSEGSAISAMAKLHCVLEQGEPVPDCLEFPWPQIRSALADLLTASTSGTAVSCDLGECRSAGRLP